MALTDSDRRRFLMATALTLVALPALWWANQNDGAPNVASAGIAVDDGVASDDTPVPNDADAGPVRVSGTLTAPADATPSEVNPAAPSTPAAVAAIPPSTDAAMATADETPDDSPVFLDGPSNDAGDRPPEIAVPVAPTGDRITTKATFRSNVGSRTGCSIPGILNGATITVVNLDNNRSVTCTTVVALNGSAPELVMHPDLFSQIADPTDAPIPVEIRR